MWTKFSISLGKMPKSANAVSYYKCILIFWEMIFQSGCTIVQSHQHCVRNPVLLHPHQYLVLSLFFILVILINVKWHLTVVLTCISLAANQVQFCMCSLAIYAISSWVKCFCHLPILQLDCFFFFLQLSFKSSLYIIDNSSLLAMWLANIFSRTVTLSFPSFQLVFLRANVLNSDGVQFIIFSSSGSWFWCQDCLANSRSQRFCHVFYSKIYSLRL